MAGGCALFGTGAFWASATEMNGNAESSRATEVARAFRTSPSPKLAAGARLTPASRYTAVLPTDFDRWTTCRLWQNRKFLRYKSQAKKAFLETEQCQTDSMKRT